MNDIIAMLEKLPEIDFADDDWDNDSGPLSHWKEM